MTFFKKNIIKERAYALFDVYVSEMASINPAFKTPISKQNLYGLFFELLYCLDPLSVFEDVSHRKVTKSVKYRQRHPSRLDIRKREYVEVYLIERLVEMPCNVKLSKGGRALAFSNIMERYSPYHGLHGVLMPELSKRSKPDVEPLPSEHLRRGTLYAGSVHEHAATAISLNKDMMSSGSVWVFESGDAEYIKSQIIALCGTPEDKVIIHTEESVEEGSFQLSFCCLQELISRIVMESQLEGDLQQELLMYCQLIGVLKRELSDFFLGYWLKADWGVVVATLRVALKGGLLSDNALEILSSVIGSNFEVLDDDRPRKPKEWHRLECLLEPYLKLLSSESWCKYSTVSVNENPDGVHHIFVGEALAELAALSFGDLKGRDLELSLADFEKRKERSYAPLFVEFKEFKVEGFLVMPAAARGASLLCPNVFISEEFLTLDGASEEFSSLKANCMTKVTSFDDSLTRYDRYRRALGGDGDICFTLSGDDVEGGATWVAQHERILLV